VLDLGCGTGLSGLALRPFALRLEGLDLSPRMLAEARRRQGLYDALHEGDLLEALPARPGAFDLVVAADVLNYLGDLAPALGAIAAALALGGVAAFSVEAGEGGAPFALAEAMRYRHDPAHVAALAEAAGLAVVARREGVALRTERGLPVLGALFVLRRAVGPAPAETTET
jgi:predicted TPR repeat methyltransferase